MYNMSCDCCLIEKLDLSNFKTDKVESMFLILSDCFSLKKLNISNFNFNNSTNF